MPVTPFHFGLGLLGKGGAPRAVSLSAFVASQVVIDCESANYLFIAREWPVHRVMHTFVVAIPVAVAVGVALWAVVARLGRVRAGPLLASDCGLFQCVVGGFLGGASHPFLDGIMHSDIQPLRPFVSSNPFLGLVGLGTLHLLCLLAGAIGLLLLGLRSMLSRQPAVTPGG